MIWLKFPQKNSFNTIAEFIVNPMSQQVSCCRYLMTLFRCISLLIMYVIVINYEEDMNVSIKSHDSPSKRCWDMKQRRSVE